MSDLHTSRCAKCGALSAMPHAYDVACVQGPHDWRTLVEQRSSPMPGEAETKEQIQEAAWERGRQFERSLWEEKRAADGSGEALMSELRTVAELHRTTLDGGRTRQVLLDALDALRNSKPFTRKAGES